MNKTMLIIAVGVVVTVGQTASADITLIASGSGTDGKHMYISSGGAAYNSVPAGKYANIYVDIDQDGVFGETGIGENTGNSSASLAFEAPVVSGVPFHFGMEGFGVANETGFIQFRIRKTDLSIETLDVTEGTPESFFDGTDEWTVTFDFDFGAYGDVVHNVNTGPGQSAADHQGILTLVPEPATLALAAVGLVVLRRRRKK